MMPLFYLNENTLSKSVVRLDEKSDFGVVEVVKAMEDSSVARGSTPTWLRESSSSAEKVRFIWVGGCDLKTTLL